MTFVEYLSLSRQARGAAKYREMGALNVESLTASSVGVGHFQTKRNGEQSFRELRLWNNVYFSCLYTDCKLRDSVNIWRVCRCPRCGCVHGKKSIRAIQLWNSVKRRYLSSIGSAHYGELWMPMLVKGTDEEVSEFCAMVENQPRSNCNRCSGLSSQWLPIQKLNEEIKRLTQLRDSKLEAFKKTFPKRQLNNSEKHFFRLTNAAAQLTKL